MRVRGFICVIASLTALPATWAQKAPLLDILDQELTRNFEILKTKGSPPAYFMSYSVYDVTEESVRASLGALSRSTSERRRSFDCSVHVGLPLRDNYHRLDGQPVRHTRAVVLPLDDLAGPIRRIAWYETQQAQAEAFRQWTEVNKTAPLDPGKPPAIADFSMESPVSSISPAIVPKFDREAWARRLRNLSGGFKEFPGVLQSELSATNHNMVLTLVNTEGTKLQTTGSFSRVMISSRAKAADGEDLQVNDTFEAFDPEKLPNDKTLLDTLIAQADLVIRLKRAPTGEPFKGPAIFSARAAAALIYEIVGRGIESRGAEGAPLSSQLGKPLLPDTFTLVAAPTIRQAGPYDLTGSYAFDDEGVPARPVAVVEKGILKSLLVSRTPAPGFPQSNGHGRRQPGFDPSAANSNLFVDSTSTVQADDLKAKLVAEATRQRKPYGLYVERLRAGEPIPGLDGKTVRPIMIVSAYQISTSGRKDQLVRGIALAGDPLSLLRNVVAAGDFKQALNLFEAGPSGVVPVSVVSPALLVSEIEVRGTPKPADRPPFLPQPTR